MGKKKVTPKAKNTGKPIRVEVVRAPKAKQTQKKTPQTGRTSGGQVRFEIVKAGTIPPQPKTRGMSGKPSTTVQAKQPKITKPAPEQGREKETDVVEVEIKTQRFPFWAKLKMGGKHPTLVIDEAEAMDKSKQRLVPGFVHREVTHTKNKNHEEIIPNPDPTDPDPMYLKRPDKKPKRLFTALGKNWEIPQHLQQRYEKNNNKDK